MREHQEEMHLYIEEPDSCGFHGANHWATSYLVQRHSSLKCPLPVQSCLSQIKLPACLHLLFPVLTNERTIILLHVYGESVGNRTRFWYWKSSGLWFYSRCYWRITFERQVIVCFRNTLVTQVPNLTLSAIFGMTSFWMLFCAYLTLIMH